MKNKLISAAVVVTTVTLFSIASQPKTAIGTSAMTVANVSTDFVMPTMRPFPTLNIESRTMPVISSSPKSTTTPTANTTPTTSPTATATSTTSPTSAATVQPVRTSSPTQTPQPTATPTVTAQPSTNNSSYTDQVIELVNKERANSNLGPLAKNDQLTNSAQAYTQYMADKNFFSHNGPDGSTFITRNKAAGYSNYLHLGENIAAGQRSPQEVMTAWMNSSGHRANIMKAQYKEIGVGYTSKSGTTYNTYWAQEFGSR
ncbi:MAG: CAP domain-containing protein [bacterium]|nr:CAP domain-containing protein [bacterium]